MCALANARMIAMQTPQCCPGVAAGGSDGLSLLSPALSLRMVDSDNREFHGTELKSLLKIIYRLHIQCKENIPYIALYIVCYTELSSY